METETKRKRSKLRPDDLPTIKKINQKVERLKLEIREISTETPEDMPGARQTIMQLQKALTTLDKITERYEISINKYLAERQDRIKELQAEIELLTQD